MLQVYILSLGFQAYIVNCQSLYITFLLQSCKVAVTVLFVVEIISTCSAEVFKPMDSLNFGLSSLEISPL